MTSANCAQCNQDQKICSAGGSKGGEGCPTILQADVISSAKEQYFRPEVYDFNLNSLRQVVAGYICDDEGRLTPTLDRLHETIGFAKRMGYHKLGLAYCKALQKQANELSSILQDNGFTVVSVVCKVGGIEKTEVGLKPEETIVPFRHEIMCNPIGQAYLLNAAGTELNILLGLCVGHDAMFLKNSNAYCTVFVVKDRVYQHNSLAGLEAETEKNAQQIHSSQSAAVNVSDHA